MFATVRRYEGIDASHKDELDEEGRREFGAAPEQAARLQRLLPSSTPARAS